MLAALVIVFREVLEAGLIIGVVLAASRGVTGRNGAVGLGILAGIAGSVLVALFASRISDAFDGRGQELFIAAILLFAVLMLAWHVVWMAEHAREMTLQLRKLGSDVAAGSQSLFALGAAVAVAVMREGSEVVLFLTGIVMQGKDTGGELLIGSLGGLCAWGCRVVDPLFRTGGYSVEAHVLSHRRSRHAFGRRSRGLGRAAIVERRRAERSRHPSLGYVLDSLRVELARPHPSRSDRLHGSANGHAVDCLRGDGR